MNDPLIWVRAAHFAATISVAGIIFFECFVAQPAFRFAGNNSPLPSAVRLQLSWIVWIGLGLVIITGAAWLVLVSEQIADLPLGAVLSQGMVWTILGNTDFGHDWAVRLILAVLLAGTLFWHQLGGMTGSRRTWTVTAVLAAGLIGTLAWSGHAAGKSSLEGKIHLCADVLHLIAAAAWIGALVPLALLLRAVRADQNETSVAIGRATVMRFSTLGIVSVGTLTVTGIVNSWVLVGNLTALTNTNYGWLLMVKIVLFCIMLSVAAVNRFRLTPRLTQEQRTIASRDALRQIECNGLIEASVGALIIVIIAVLGTLPPGAEQAP